MSKKLIKSSKSKTCSLDPDPTWLLKSCSVELLPIITEIINHSLSTSTFSSVLKQALVYPLIKKVGLDKEDYCNYRPVSNLSFISKLIEKVVLDQLNKHLSLNELSDNFQSAYRKFHSTETALVKVQSDIMNAIDGGSAAVLVLLDLSAAFDVLDHSILLNRLENICGIRTNALDWFKSYLTSRVQAVQVKDRVSNYKSLPHGVPQVSCIGPQLFSVYIQPLGALIRRHGINYHCYADDTQLYLTFLPDQPSTALSKLELCISEVRVWMSHNMLMLNENKTEVMIFSSKARFPLVRNLSVQVGDTIIKSASSVRNLGVRMSTCMSMDTHINSICCSSYMHLRTISKIRQYLTKEATKTLTHALVLSRIDYANALLCAAPDYTIAKLQQVQNVAAGIITKTSRHDHITPALMSLHWLPVKQRVKFKALLLVYKALNGLAPGYICDLLKIRTPARTLRSSNSQFLVVPPRKTVTYGDKCFSSYAPLHWNVLPANIRNADSILTFKKQLKTFLFKESYNV